MSSEQQPKPSAGNFRGRHTGALDAQDRFSVPSAWRKMVDEQMAALGKGEGHTKMIASSVEKLNDDGEVLFTRLVLAPVHVAEQIWADRQQVIDEEQDEDYAELLQMDLDATRHDSFDANWDKNGRTKLPPQALSIAAIAQGEKTELVFSGSGERFEIWAADQYDTFRAYRSERIRARKVPHAMGFAKYRKGTDNNTSTDSTPKGGAA